MSILECRQVYYKDKNQEILKDISIKIEKQDFVSIIGASGSGKSTFLKMCGHLISPSQGMILYQEENMCSYNPLDLRRKISYVCQTPYLFGNTVEDNMKFPYSVRNEPYNQKHVEKWCERLGLEASYLNRSVDKLSGGEKQRMAFIRSVLFLPEILLLDEASSALDSENKKRMEGLVSELNKTGMTIFWITHDISQNAEFTNKVITMESGQIISLEEK